jgi:hypothetical protein
VHMSEPRGGGSWFWVQRKGDWCNPAWIPLGVERCPVQALFGMAQHLKCGAHGGHWHPVPWREPSLEVVGATLWKEPCSGPSQVWAQRKRGELETCMGIDGKCARDGLVSWRVHGIASCACEGTSRWREQLRAQGKGLVHNPAWAVLLMGRSLTCGALGGRGWHPKQGACGGSNILCAGGIFLLAGASQ